MSWTSVITDVGRTLLNTWAAGEATLHFDAPKCGSGTVETSELRSQEDVADYESDGRIASKQPVSGGYKLGIQIKSNEGDEYTLHQVGLFAHLGDDGESTLIALMQDPTGVTIPAKSVTPDYVYMLYTVISLGEGDLEVTIDGSAYVSAAEMDEALDAKVDAVPGKGLSTNDFTNFHNLRNQRSVHTQYGGTGRGTIFSLADIKSIIDTFVGNSNLYVGYERTMMTMVYLANDITDNGVTAKSGSYTLLINSFAMSTSIGYLDISVYLLGSSINDNTTDKIIPIKCITALQTPTVISIQFGKMFEPYVPPVPQRTSSSFSGTSVMDPSSHIDVTKYANVVIVSGYVKLSSSSGGGTTIGTISDAAYRPAVPMYAMAYGQSDEVYTGLTLNTNGTLVTARSMQAGMAYHFTFTFFAN